MKLEDVQNNKMYKVIYTDDFNDIFFNRVENDNVYQLLRIYYGKPSVNNPPSSRFKSIFNRRLCKTF